MQEWSAFSVAPHPMLQRYNTVKQKEKKKIYIYMRVILTDDSTTLGTVNIFCADFHPTVEVHLKRATFISIAGIDV